MLPIRRVREIEIHIHTFICNRKLFKSLIDPRFRWCFTLRCQVEHEYRKISETIPPIESRIGWIQIKAAFQLNMLFCDVIHHIHSLYVEIYSNAFVQTSNSA